MRIILYIFVLLPILLNSANICSQEWNNLRFYFRETGNETLQNGCWLKKDRKKQTAIWDSANIYNLLLEDGFKKYQSIKQIRDFYRWFDEKRKQQGHDIKAAGVAGVVANQFSKFEIDFIRVFIIRNKEIVNFAFTGSELVFEFAFPLMKEIYFSPELITGVNAQNWSLINGKAEQCEILEPLYTEMSPKALNRLEKMAKGKGIFFLGVPKKLRYEGDITDCNQRLNHAINKVLPYYLKHSDL